MMTRIVKKKKKMFRLLSGNTEVAVAGRAGKRCSAHVFELIKNADDCR